MTIARHFDAAKDDGSIIFGVPKADITEDEWAALPDWLKASVDASGMYRKTPVREKQDRKGDD